MTQCDKPGKFRLREGGDLVGWLQSIIVGHFPVVRKAYTPENRPPVPEPSRKYVTTIVGGETPASTVSSARVLQETRWPRRSVLNHGRSGVGSQGRGEHGG